MTDIKESNEIIMWELNDVFIYGSDKTTDEEEKFSSHEDAVTDDIPPSLISYFETSKSRAAVCEKVILEELEDFTASFEDMMNLPTELDEDKMKLNVQVISEKEKENENNASTDTCLLPAPTETDMLLTHNVAVFSHDEDETEIDEHMGSVKHLTFEVSNSKTSLKEEEIKKSTEYQREHREKQHLEEMKKEEQRKQRENDFQEELKKIIEREKLHQMEIELMEKKAQEKLEQEMLLQQELISNLQKQVEEERRMRKEELKRIKEEEEKKRKETEEKKKREEEDRKKKEEEKIKREMQRGRMEEEMRRKKDEEEKRKIKEEEQRKKKEEEEKRRMEKDEKRKREEEKNKMEEEKRKREEERKIKERNKIRLKEEEKLRQMEEEERKKEKEENIKERGNNKEREAEETRKREGENKMIEVAGKKIKNEGDKKKNEEITLKEEWREEEGKTQVEEDKRREEAVKINDHEVRTQQEKMMKKKREERKSDEERRKAEVEKMIDEQTRKKEEENRKIEDEMQLKKEKEKRKKHVEMRNSIENKDIRKKEEKIKEDEWRKRQEEEMRLKEQEEEYRKIEEETRLWEKEGNKTYEAESRKVEHDRKTKDIEKVQEQVKKKLDKDGMRKREEEGINIGADTRQIKEEVTENEDNIKTKERRLKEEEENKKIIVQDEKEERLKRTNDQQEKKQESNSMNTQNERKNTDSTGHSLASQLENSTTRTSSSCGPLYNESTVNPTSSETVQQHDLDKNINQIYICKTMDPQDAAEKPCTSSGSLLVCHPEHTDQKRLSWMKGCITWSKLSLQNRRKQKGPVRSRRLQRKAAEASSLPPLCLDTLLQSTGWKSLQEVTTVTLEDLSGCNLSTLVQCTQLWSLTLRRCGLRSLEGISQLQKLCYIDVEENDISFVDCENMTCLRVLRLGHNKLSSIHGLSGTDNLDVLVLSHNSITRIAGLESMRRLQRLSVDHNQLISTKGLRDVYTLLHLNCSHNHLASVDGLENSALLNTLDLRANSLTEPPSLNNHILLRELHLDDNSISSLQGLTACWLPLMQHLSVSQNRITQLPSMSDFVSLAKLDLRFNCMSELQNVCESLEGCQFLQDIHLTGNPLQQENGWRSTLHKALPGLRAIDDQETDCFLSSPAVQQISLASDFLTFCQAQLQQIHNLQQQHSRELSKASSSLDALKSSCRHFTEMLKLAEDQRFAHEYGDTTGAAGQAVLEKTVDMEGTSAEMFTEHSQMESTEKVPPAIPSRNDIRHSYWTFEEKPSTESWCHTLDTVKTVPKTGLHSLATKEKTSSSNFEMAALSNHQDLDLKNTAAVVIQQQWKKYRQKCGNVSGPPATAKRGGRGGDGGKPESGPSDINGSVVDQHYAATVIQAFWRGYTLRTRLATALAAVTCPSTREDDTFEEVDVDEFVFDEAALEKHWTMQLSEDSPSRHDPVSVQPLSLTHPGPFPEPSQCTLAPPLVWRPKQAWVATEQVDSAGQRVSPESSNRKSPASTSALSGISERSEKILEEWGFTDSHTALLMLKRAQKMKSKQQQKRKRKDPSVRLALFRNCNYQMGPVVARNRHEPHRRNCMEVSKAKLGIQQAERTEQVKEERAQQWLHTQSDRNSESEHFLPEISSDILNGGRVQLVADPAYTERHHASGLWANSSLAAQPSKQNSYPNRISLGHARKDVPFPKRVMSAPSRKERISFRDNPVQLSGGWGGGKKSSKTQTYLQP